LDLLERGPIEHTFQVEGRVFGSIVEIVEISAVQSVVVWFRSDDFAKIQKTDSAV